MGGILRPLLAEPAKHLLRLARDPDYRTWRDLERRLGRVPRRTPRRVRAGRLLLDVPDAASFLGAFHEIFVERSLEFPSWAAAPRILDLGANIGLSVLAFLRDHPDARITAVEPDPAIFAILERNVRGNGGASVRLIQAAAWSGSGTLRFRSDGADGGRARGGEAAPALGGDATAGAVPDASPAAGEIEVPAVDVAALFDEGPFDVVKMDIEGAERVVLPALGERLRRVRCLFVEVHSGPGDRAPLAALLEPIERAGLEVHIHTVRARPHPFLDEGVPEEFDLLLHVYGVRR